MDNHQYFINYLINNDGAFTSCGTQGEQGPKGETGATGAKGEQGEKGEKGDTYYPVVILGAEDGEISTDVISGKSGDKYTLTFTPDYADYVVTSLYINYEEVEITDEILEGSYTGTFSADAKNGAVVVSATFSDVEAYSEKLVASVYNKLVFGFGGTDKQMPCLFNGTKGYASTNLVDLFTAYAKVNEAYKPYIEACAHGDYYNTDVATLALTYVEKVETEFNKSANKNKSAKEKIAIVKEILADAEKAISEKYNDVVKTAKDRATNAAKYLFNNGEKVAYVSDSLSKENSAKLLAEAIAKIEAASTLSEISSVVDNSTYSTGAKLGSYSETERMRAIAYTEANAGLNTVKGKDSALTPDLTNSSAAEAYETLKEELAAFGVTELPYDVLATYKGKINDATSFEYSVSNEKTNYESTVLGSSAKKAVVASYTNIITALRTGILESYDKEIYSSKVLTEEKTRDNCSTVVENAIAAWVKSSNNAGVVAKFVSYDYTSDDSCGLLGYIEHTLEKWNVEFTAERLSNKKKSVIENLKATYNSILEGDSIYKAIVELKAESDETLSDNDYTSLDNKLGIAKGTTESIKETHGENANVATILATAIGSDGKGGKNTKIYDSSKDIKSLSEFESEQKAALKAAYGKVTDSSENSAMELFKEKNDIELGSYTGHIITKDVLTSAYAKLFSYVDEESGKTVIVTKNMNEIKAAVKASENWKTDVTDLDTKYGEWIEKTKENDSALGNHTTDSNSKVWKAINDQVNAILTGKTTGVASNTSVVSTLNALYEEDVANYLSKALGALKTVEENKFSTLYAGGKPEKAEKLETVYKAVLALKGESSFSYQIGDGEEITAEKNKINKCETYTGVDTFNKVVLEVMKAADDGESVKLNDKTIIE